MYSARHIYSVTCVIYAYCLYMYICMHDFIHPYIYFPVLHAINERFAAGLAVAVVLVVVVLLLRLLMLINGSSSNNNNNKVLQAKPNKNMEFLI